MLQHLIPLEHAYAAGRNVLRPTRYASKTVIIKEEKEVVDYFVQVTLVWERIEIWRMCSHRNGREGGCHEIVRRY